MNRKFKVIIFKIMSLMILNLCLPGKSTGVIESAQNNQLNNRNNLFYEEIL